MYLGYSGDSNVERLQFTDGSLALDLHAGGSARNTALMIGAAFGAAVVGDRPDYVAIGLELFDAGYSLQQVAALCVNAGLASAPDNESFVTAVWLNVVGSPIDAASLAAFTGLLQGSGGSLAQADLLALAAASQWNVEHVGIARLQETGLAYA